MTDESSACITKPGRSFPLAVLAAAWVIYLGLIGPWLISEPSTVAVLLGVLVALALAAATYARIARAITTTKEPTR
jgi:hypothetical protein